MTYTTRTHFVYTAWDSAGRPLYVGCTRQPKIRQQTHKSLADWYQYATRFTMTGPYPEDVALTLERGRIVTIRPHFNWQPEYAKDIRARSARMSDHLDNDALDIDTIEALLDAEFGLHTTAEGRHRMYHELLASQAVAA